MWVDNWSPLDRLNRRFGTRIIYDADSNVNATRSVLIRMDGVCLP